MEAVDTTVIVLGGKDEVYRDNQNGEKEKEMCGEVQGSKKGRTGSNSPTKPTGNERRAENVLAKIKLTQLISSPPPSPLVTDTATTTIHREAGRLSRHEEMIHRCKG